LGQVEFLYHLSATSAVQAMPKVSVAGLNGEEKFSLDSDEPITLRDLLAGARDIQPGCQPSFLQGGRLLRRPDDAVHRDDAEVVTITMVVEKSSLYTAIKKIKDAELDIARAEAKLRRVDLLSGPQLAAAGYPLASEAHRVLTLDQTLHDAWAAAGSAAAAEMAAERRWGEVVLGSVASRAATIRTAMAQDGDRDVERGAAQAELASAEQALREAEHELARMRWTEVVGGKKSDPKKAVRAEIQEMRWRKQVLKIGKSLKAARLEEAEAAAAAIRKADG